MALGKQIANSRTGHVNGYWRLTAISIDAGGAHITLVLSGYATEAARLAGLQPDDSRYYELGAEAFLRLASGDPVGETVYNVIASACYAEVVAWADGAGEFSDAAAV